MYVRYTPIRARAREGCETPVFKRPCSGVFILVLKCHIRLAAHELPVDAEFRGRGGSGHVCAYVFASSGRIDSRGVLGAFRTVHTL